MDSNIELKYRCLRDAYKHQYSQVRRNFVEGQRVGFMSTVEPSPYAVGVGLDPCLLWP